MLHLYGVPVSADDARQLVDRLYQDAHADAVSAALVVEKGLDRELYAVALTREQRTAVLGVLDEPPEGLAELRGRLLRSHETG